MLRGQGEIKWRNENNFQRVYERILEMAIHGGVI